jgi:ribose transport system permease protein
MADYGVLLGLVLLCLYYTWVTWEEQHPIGSEGAEQLAEAILADCDPSAAVLIVGGTGTEDEAFAATLEERLAASGMTVYPPVEGQPIDVRREIEQMGKEGKRLDLIACVHEVSVWPVFDALPALRARYPLLARAVVRVPPSHHGSSFLTRQNLLNVADQIVVIAIIAIGMTMVIITGGIDLSVGSLIALAGVVATLLVSTLGGESEAGVVAIVLGCLGAILVCAASGLFSGLMVTLFAIPPFIVTLAMMLVARGLAYILAQGQSISDVPESFVWLGGGADLYGIPNAVVLMVVLYAVAHFMMTRMRMGRYIYAVGGNAEAARLSGISVRTVLLFVYAVCGALAGLGGVVTASRLKHGLPNTGVMYELYVIAAVVVGGTSLAGGQGKVLATLIGAFIIAVIRNGMNLTGVESYTQNVVLGLVILGAVLLDMLKRRDWSWLWNRLRSRRL